MIALTEQERQILSLVTPVAEQIGMEIVRLRIQGGRRPHLQIMAERAGGAPTNVEDCASLSRAIAPMLDEALINFDCRISNWCKCSVLLC